MAVVVPTVEELIEQLAPDLQGLLDARKVGRQTQADLAKIGVDSIAMLSAIAINREGLEKVAKDMLSIDVAGGGGDEQIKFAQLYLAWQAATKRVKVQDEMDAEASAQKEPKPVPPQELMALRQKFEAEFYKLKDAEVPSKASMLFEQIDLGEFRPMALRHFGSRADNEEAEVGNLHVAKSGQVKIRKSRVETSAPVTLEDFRAKVILMANHYLFARFRYPNKQLLQKINPFTFLDYLGYLTGKHVAQMETQTVDGVTLHRTDRKTSVRSVLERFSKFYSEGFTIECEEWDICRGPHQDLLEEKTQKDLLARIARGEFIAVILSPPCASWSRAPWANRWGPRPLRTVLHPWGMPWLEGAKLEKVAKSNGMIRFCIQVIRLVAPLPTTSFLLEHPEDLGSVSSRPSVTVRPASIWQLPELRALAVGPVYTIVFYQCAMGAGSRKPTRFLTDLPDFRSLGPTGWPQLDRLARYVGPLPAQCACGRSHSGLIKRSADDAFSTTVAAAYPPQLDMFIAWAIWKFTAAQSFEPASPAGGVQQMQGKRQRKKGHNHQKGLNC
eukprot:symbB.v1.2.031217.t1/scaffold3599.1/size55909/2